MRTSRSTNEDRTSREHAELLPEMLTPEVQRVIRHGTDTGRIVRELFRDNFGRPVELIGNQLDIVEEIVYGSHPEVAIAAYTGYGKTFLAHIGLTLLSIKNNGIKSACISITKNQSNRSYEYILNTISREPRFSELLSTNVRSLEELRKYLNRDNITLGDSRISVLTINKNKGGESLLGHHDDVVLEDESAEIPDEISRTKIFRMLEEAPGDLYPKKHIKISTTHHRGLFREWCLNPIPGRRRVFIIDAETGIKEGRVTRGFIDKQKERMTEEEFDVWYMCKFPDEDEDSFFRDSEINKLLEPFSLSSHVWTDTGFEKSLGIDCAGFGPNKTVFTLTVRHGNHFVSKVPLLDGRLCFMTSSDPDDINGMAIRLVEAYPGIRWLVPDAVGEGAGVASGLRNYYHDQAITVLPFKAGNKPTTLKNKEDYYNVASMCYGFGKEMINSGFAHYVDNSFIRKELEGIKKEYAGGKMIHVAKKGSKYDPELPSPDFADSWSFSLYPWVERTVLEFFEY